MGSRIPLSGVNVQALARYMSGARGGLLGLYEMVFQGGLYRGAVLGLGIMPYLTARIYMRLWRAVDPKAEPSRRATRILTIALSVIQSLGVATFLQGAPGVVAAPGPGFITKTVLTLTGGSLVAMWFGEQITERGEADDEEEVSVPSERPEALPAPAALALPASPPIHQRSSSDRETARKPK
jgi:preprotein translocase subunit SecY